MVIELNTGKVAFNLLIDGVWKRIYFNPLDFDLYRRIANFEKKIAKRMEEVADIEIDKNGNVVDEKFTDAFFQFQEKFCEEIDNIFQSPVSKVVFETCSPFTEVEEGKLFVTHFLEGIMPAIDQKIQEYAEKKKKHTGKYEK